MQIEGRNPVLEALLANRPIHKILAAQGAVESKIMQQIFTLAKKRGVPVHRVQGRTLDRMTSTKHQGVIAICAEQKYFSLEEILENTQARSLFLLILDEIDSPQNLGATLRTADAAGIHGIIIPKRRSVGLTPAVAKVSTGATEYVPIAKVTNIAATIERLKKEGVKVVGATQEAKQLYFDADLTGPIAIVIGSEAKGIRRLVKERCDFLVRIPMKGHISCLNAGVAASLLVYEKIRQETKKVKAQ